MQGGVFAPYFCNTPAVFTGNFNLNPLGVFSVSMDFAIFCSVLRGFCGLQVKIAVCKEISCQFLRIFKL